jgi:hypothetical protein
MEGLAKFWIVEVIFVQRYQLEGDLIRFLVCDTTMGCREAYLALPAYFKSGVVVHDIPTHAANTMFNDRSLTSSWSSFFLW